MLLSSLHTVGDDWGLAKKKRTQHKTCFHCDKTIHESLRWAKDKSNYLAAIGGLHILTQRQHHDYAIYKFQTPK